MHPVLIIQGFFAPTATNLVLKTRLKTNGFLAKAACIAARPAALWPTAKRP